jgi:hypothetical protein
MRTVAYRRSPLASDGESPIDGEPPLPVPGPRELPVRVEAIARSPVDHSARQDTAPGAEPKVLGRDAAGTVFAVGEEVRLFQAGDDVYGADAVDRPGTNAHFRAVDERIAATLGFAPGHGADPLVDHHKPLGPRLTEVAPRGPGSVLGTTGTHRDLADHAGALSPFGRIVAIDDSGSPPIGSGPPAGAAGTTSSAG